MQDVIDIQVTPLSPACGAEIGGVDLTKPLAAETVRAIKDAWAKHLVLVFPGQQVSQDDQLRFASYFGELGDRKKAPEQLRSRAEGIAQDHKKILLVTNIKVDGQPIGAFGDGEFWFHIDSGYSAVPGPLKEKLKGKKALHIHEYNRAKQATHTGDIGDIPHHFHPVFVTHPETGRKTLFVDRLMTVRI